jgi:hypothetical protein
MSPEPDTLTQRSFDQHAIVVTDSSTYKQLTFGKPDASLLPISPDGKQYTETSIKPKSPDRSLRCLQEQIITYSIASIFELASWR